MIRLVELDVVSQGRKDTYHKKFLNVRQILGFKLTTTNIQSVFMIFTAFVNKNSLCFSDIAYFFIKFVCSPIIMVRIMQKIHFCSPIF